MTASTKDLIERARYAAPAVRMGDACPADADTLEELADALERLTQPEGEVEPLLEKFARACAFGSTEDRTAEANTIRATVARLIAERDAAIESRNARERMFLSATKERDALQEQVKMLRAAISNAVGLAGRSDLRRLLSQALAATEPKEGEKA